MIIIIIIMIIIVIIIIIDHITTTLPVIITITSINVCHHYAHGYCPLLFVPCAT